MRIGEPSSENQAATVTASTTSPVQEDRFEFINWFGANANSAKVHSPVNELRKARAHTANMPEAQTTNAPAQPVRISNNSRLELTYADGLPDPNGTAPALRGPDITGSVNATDKPASTRAKTQAPAPQTSDDELVQRELKQLEQRLLDAQKRQQQAKATPAPSPQPQVPDRSNPKRLQLALNTATFNQDEIAVLKEIAQLHAKTGRAVHIHAVTRGLSGDTRLTTTRIRRLQLHANRAVAALVHYGVPQTSITTSTAEQRMTGVSLDATTAGDRDRLELSLQ